MLTINLLPEAYRKPSAGVAQTMSRSPLVIVAVAVMMGIWALSWLVLTVRQIRHQGLSAKLQALQPRKKMTDELLVIVQKLGRDRAVFDQLTKQRRQWASRLNRLSDLTPAGIWFTDFMLDPNKGLTIQGSAIGQGGEEMVRIGRLVQDLKADAEFSAMVQDIQIESIKSIQQKDIEIVQFTLTGRLATAMADQPPAS